ncbi:MAG: RnfABCDGE type electron transport complex subunit D [Rikenellaceae bacterium]|nr:RnfABCDGE type electron transport complex subunit D [Rikenellaceae bacterium]
MEKKLIVAPSPHVHDSYTTTTLMRDVLVALIPALAVTTVIYGIQVLVVTAVSVAACVLFEYLIQRFMLGGRSTVGDLSAVVTGVLLAFNLPVSIPLWLVILGALVAIGVGKMTFGGLGRNPFNPALVGRVFLLLSFPVAMTTYPAPAGVDAMSGATPLTFLKEAVKNGQPLSELMPEISYGNLLYGLHGGSLGEIAALALILGFGYMLLRRVITWHIPVAVLGSMAVFAAVLWGFNPDSYADPLFHILTGGALLGAIFMATDYATSPMSKSGMLAYGAGIGIITILIRNWGSYPEGISFAILIMNAVVPLINKYMRPRRFGEPAKS